MEKRRRSESQIITARGGAAGDGHHNIYTSTNCVEDFDEEIRRFGIDRKVPEALSLYVSLSEKTQVLWYEKLLEAWVISDSPPDTPEEATKLVYETLKRVHPYGLDIGALEGFLLYHGLPGYFSPSKPVPRGEASPVAEEARKFTLDTFGLRHLVLTTLPVNASGVTDGLCFTVSVEIKEFYLLPPDILFAISERSRALTKGDKQLAHTLLRKINAGDYEVVEIDGVEVLTKKYSIRLRGIEAMRIFNWVEARNKLSKMVDGKCLTIIVLHIDECMHCVGDVYDNGISLKEKLLTEAAATYYDDTPVIARGGME